GIEIRITTGPDTGKTGWVYYPIEKARRKLKLLDKEGHSVSSPSENTTSFMQDFSKQQQLLDESRKKISSLKATDSDIKDIDNVWLNIYEGNYLIDTEHDDGGAFLPILRKVQNGNEQPKIERFYVPRSYERILAMTSHLNLSLDLS